LKLNIHALKIVIIGIVALLLFACGGPKPDGTWTSAEYFKYALQMYEDEDYFESVNEFTVITLRYPGSVYSDSAQYYLGMCHFQMDEYIISAAEFNKLIEEMSRSPLVPDAQYMLGESFFQLSPRAELDQGYTMQAIKHFQIFLEDYPTNKSKEEVEKKLLSLREKLAEKEWRNAEIYRKMKKLRASLIYYEIVLNNFYDTDFADDAQFGKGLVYMELEEWQNAKNNFMLFKEKFPDNELIVEVEESLSEIDKLKAEEETEQNEEKEKENITEKN
jgi:outer membrane protein assembly factor BamD